MTSLPSTRKSDAVGHKGLAESGGQTRREIAHAIGMAENNHPRVELFNHLLRGADISIRRVVSTAYHLRRCRPYRVFRVANSWATLATPLPNTTAEIASPVSAAIFCAATSASSDVRLSAPSRCSIKSKYSFAHDSSGGRWPEAVVGGRWSVVVFAQFSRSGKY